MAKLFRRDNKWGIAYTDHRGKRIRKMISGDRRIAQMALGEAVAAVERLKVGCLQADPREAKRDLQDHIDAFLSDMRRRGRDEMYVYVIRRHLEGAARAHKWACLADCTPLSISARLKTLADKKLSGKTVNGHRSDFNIFFGWCVRNGLMESNPCAAVPKTTIKAEKKRRALSVAECQALLNAAPPDRRACYQFLIYTGLRRSEAGAICWGHVHLEPANPYLELPASLTKSGKPESVPLVADVAAALTAKRGSAKDGQPVFDEIPSMEDFRADLAAAGIEEVDARGRRVVLHSLRHSLCTMMAASGVPMVIAQRVMRHRDIKLTAESYLDEGLLPLSAAMAALPRLTATA